MSAHSATRAASCAPTAKTLVGSTCSPACGSGSEGRRKMKHIIAGAAALLLADIAVAHPEANQSANAATIGAVAPSARPAAAVVDAFHAALRRGDTKAALSYLAENALIYEAGGVERGREEYASHHLGADSAFAQAVPGTLTRRAGEVVG